MEPHEIRAKNLQLLIDERFNGIAGRLAEFIGKQPSYIYRIFTDKEEHKRNVGERMARDIEARLGLPRGWLDLAQGDAGEPESPLLLTPKQRALLGLFEGLTEAQQDEVIRLIQKQEQQNKEVIEQLANKAKGKRIG